MLNTPNCRTRIAIGIAALLTTASVTLADARAWLSGPDLPADVVLTLRSVDEADAALRSLTRAAQINWLPTASRLLEATNLRAGLNTGRPLAIALLPGGDDDSAPTVVSILPSTTPEQLLKAFEAEATTDSTDLYTFSFADREYAARVLPDGHVAISTDAGALRSLRFGEASQPLTAAPMRLELVGAGSLNSLNSLLQQAGSDALPTAILEPLVEDAQRVIIDLTPDAQSLRADIGIVPRERGKGTDGLSSVPADPLAHAPFPGTDYVFLAHGRLDHPLLARWMKPLLTDTLGLSEETIRGLTSVSLVIDAPETLFGSGGATMSLAFEGERVESVRESMRQAISGVDGASVEPGASSRVGVTLDHVRIAPRIGDASGRPDARGGGIGAMLFGGGRMDPDAQQSISARMFTRNGRLYLTSATEGERLDRLIAFNDRTTTLESTPPLRGWLDRLGSGQDARFALNIAPLMKYLTGAARMSGNSLNLPEEVAPVVAGLRSDEQGIRATVLVPAQVIQTLEQFRLAGESRGRDR